MEDSLPTSVISLPIMTLSAALQSSRPSPVKPVHRLVEVGNHPLVDGFRRPLHRFLDRWALLPGKGGKHVIHRRHPTGRVSDADSDPFELVGAEMIDQ